MSYIKIIKTLNNQELTEIESILGKDICESSVSLPQTKKCLFSPKLRKPPIESRSKNTWFYQSVKFNQIEALDKELFERSIPYINIKDLQRHPKYLEFEPVLNKFIKAYWSMVILFSVLYCSIFVVTGLYLVVNEQTPYFVVGITVVFIDIALSLLTSSVVSKYSRKKRIELAKLFKQSIFKQELEERGDYVRKVVNKWNLQEFMPKYGIFAHTCDSGGALVFMKLDPMVGRIFMQDLIKGEMNPLLNGQIVCDFLSNDVDRTHLIQSGEYVDGEVDTDQSASYARMKA